MGTLSRVRILKFGFFIIISIFFALGFLAGCSAEPEEEIVYVTQIVEKEVVVEGEAIVVTEIVEVEVEPERPPVMVTKVVTQIVVHTATPSYVETVEDWQVGLEWPEWVYVGDSEVVQLSLIPLEDGVKFEATFSDHKTISEEIPITRHDGYLLNAIAELHANGFEISPSGPQSRELQIGAQERWLWTIVPSEPGKQRISVSLNLKWIATQPEILPRERQFGGYSKAFEIEVKSYMGLSRSQSSITGVVFTLLLLSAAVLIPVFRFAKTRKHLITRSPNANLQINSPPNIILTNNEQKLIQAVFQNYSRVEVEKEFLSGYSGARTLLFHPLRANDKADAPSIIKLSSRENTTKEFRNYNTHVKHTLPPITARIQQAPVTFKNSKSAALQYTFVGTSREQPASLREVLLKNPGHKWISGLVDTFGHHWWMQRQPYTFRLVQEYDRRLPAHYTIKPASRGNRTINGKWASSDLELNIGDRVRLVNFTIQDQKRNPAQSTLISAPQAGKPPLRMTCLENVFSKEFTGEVVETRENYLKTIVKGFDLFGLPDPLVLLPEILQRTIHGTRSVIHGDLNLENVLIGPGGIPWLIDFAETREGHTLYDFAQLTMEVIAHVISEQKQSPEEFKQLFMEEKLPLINDINKAASQFLFDPNDETEYYLAQIITCIGTLKFKNLEPHAKQLLYLMAANLINKLN